MPNFREYLQQSAPTQMDPTDALSQAYGLLYRQNQTGQPTVTAQQMLPATSLSMVGLPQGPVNLFNAQNLSPFTQALSTQNQPLSSENALTAAQSAINYWKQFNPNVNTSPTGETTTETGDGTSTGGGTTGGATPVYGDWNYIGGVTSQQMNTLLNDLQQSNNYPEYFSGISSIMSSGATNQEKQTQINDYFSARPWLRTYFGPGGGVQVTPSVSMLQLSGYF